MNNVLKWFGSGKDKNKSPSPQEAIQRLRGVEEMLLKKSAFLEKKIDSELSIAKKNGVKNKRVALQALKRKKRYEKNLQQIDGTLTTIEFQREALENASTNSEVLNVMSTAAQALRGAHNNMDVDKVHDLMDDVVEQQDLAKEISDAISNPVGFQDVDDDDLLAELEELEQEELDKQLLDVNTVSDQLPSVPDAEPVAARAAPSKQQDDDEMAQLAAWAN